MCQPRSGPRFSGVETCMCGCGGAAFRRYFSAAEEVQRMENYRDQLKSELAGVEERLSELKSK